MKKNHYTLIGILALCFSFASSTAQERTNPLQQDQELGKVSWYRDYDVATSLSKKENKPVLILFQEVPGCTTCRNYGDNVLSNPLLVEAIEDLFIPLVIHNNKGGKDRAILNQFNEPSWNNPVVRIVDATGAGLAPRVAGNYSAKGLYTAMRTALAKTYAEIPEYMNLLGKELSAVHSTKEKYYSMYCFWTGEKQLGATEGVLNTEAGFMKGREVVKVTYDDRKVDIKALDTYAKRNNFTPITEDNSYRPASNDEDYYLRHTPYKYLPLSNLQKTKINSALGKRKDATVYLSPRQQKWLQDIKTNKSKREVLFDKSFATAWKRKLALSQG
ncbi:VPGUxxT family thioredoxin-like (seleno)protein, type 2 [uncultured Dokdonia sp.]|uniref:VPGUxxT family thioredoxin-like (seleno)protein, type 2 n=1 Tax=uncultured Dokdonia sp. TaxID=575653 RepID=UPI0026050062|nr:VPGUxxT family thioredoxin-like (seleno)protein, type 2 [uncultured Dokdonia sp.]